LSDQLLLKLQRPRVWRREDFVVSAPNADAVAALDRWPAWPAAAIALTGPDGSGKTHLAQAWATSVGAIRLSDISPEALLNVARSTPPVLLEDADRVVDEEPLFHLINLAARPERGLLMTSRTLPAAWRVNLPDLKSRLNAINVIELGPPDDEILAGVLRNLFAEKSIRPSDELLAYLVRRIDRSIPEARRVVDRLDAIGGADMRPITRALAREILDQELFDPDAPEGSGDGDVLDEMF
jgi:chromosomal replication initiation ATPase DnaA